MAACQIESANILRNNPNVFLSVRVASAVQHELSFVSFSGGNSTNVSKTENGSEFSIIGGFTEKSLNTVWQYNTTSGYWTFLYYRCVFR
jgi:hypothetical protein